MRFFSAKVPNTISDKQWKELQRREARTVKWGDKKAMARGKAREAQRGKSRWN